MDDRIYERIGLKVLWKPTLCQHCGNCAAMLPEVFQPESRPWVKVDAAEIADIVRVVQLCPSGALACDIG